MRPAGATTCGTILWPDASKSGRPASARTWPLGSAAASAGSALSVGALQVAAVRKLFGCSHLRCAVLGGDTSLQILWKAWRACGTRGPWCVAKPSFACRATDRLPKHMSPGIGTFVEHRSLVVLNAHGGLPCSDMCWESSGQVYTRILQQFGA